MCFAFSIVFVSNFEVNFVDFLFFFSRCVILNFHGRKFYQCFAFFQILNTMFFLYRVVMNFVVPTSSFHCRMDWDKCILCQSDSADKLILLFAEKNFGNFPKIRFSLEMFARNFWESYICCFSTHTGLVAPQLSTKVENFCLWRTERLRIFLQS